MHPTYRTKCAYVEPKGERVYPKQPLLPPNTPCTPPKQLRNAPHIPQKALTLSRKADECKPLAAVAAAAPKSVAPKLTRFLNGMSGAGAGMSGTGAGITAGVAAATAARVEAGAGDGAGAG